MFLIGKKKNVTKISDVKIFENLVAFDSTEHLQIRDKHIY